MAEGLLRSRLAKLGRTDVQVLSGGVGTPGGVGATLETVEVMQTEGIDVSSHIAQPVTPELIRNADLIFCMEELHRNWILSVAPEAKSKTHLLKEFMAQGAVADPNIPDPIGRPKEVYESCLLTIQEAVERLAHWLENSARSR